MDINWDMLTLVCMYTTYRTWTVRCLTKTIFGGVEPTKSTGPTHIYVEFRTTNSVGESIPENIGWPNDAETMVSFAFYVRPIGPVVTEADAIREVLRAIELTERHERLEFFRYQGKTIFQPHRVMT